MISLDDPKKLVQLRDQAHQVAMNMLRPISRKYDAAEHEYPKELDLLAAMIDGLSESGASNGAGAAGVKRDDEEKDEGRSRQGVKNGTNLASVLGIAEMCWGDVGLLLSLPRQGLGNSAIASVASPEQQERFAGVWAGMAITEPGTGSDSANISTTAVLDGDEYVLNGEKIFVTSGDRCDAVVVWATLDRSPGPGRDQVLRGAQGHARHDRRAARAQARHQGLRHRDDPVRGLPGAGREPAGLARDRCRQQGPPGSAVRWRPSTTPARSWPRWPSAVPARRST